MSCHVSVILPLRRTLAPLARRRQPAAILLATLLRLEVPLVVITPAVMTGTMIVTLATMILLLATALRVVHLATTALRLIPLGVPVHLTILVPLIVVLGATRPAKYFKVRLQTLPYN